MTVWAISVAFSGAAGVRLGSTGEMVKGKLQDMEITRKLENKIRIRFVIAVILLFSLDNQSGLALSSIKPAVGSMVSRGFMICLDRLFAQKIQTEPVQLHIIEKRKDYLNCTGIREKNKHPQFPAGVQLLTSNGMGCSMQPQSSGFFSSFVFPYLSDFCLP
jgi:hypothetical protein